MTCRCERRRDRTVKRRTPQSRALTIHGRSLEVFALRGIEERFGARLAAISGEVAVDASGRLVGGSGHAAQASQCFINVRNALAAMDAGPNNILQMRIHVVRHSPDLVPAIFAAGRDIFGNRWPTCASAWIGVESLAMPELLVEIEVLVAIE
jgi:enamine deaminase RidA (YjgF/YER057c/UK114 family)